MSCCCAIPLSSTCSTVCAISLPVHAKGDAPIGLMLAATRERDVHLLRVAQAVEAIL
jgi:aspartyl-tRNA(Asn)/glutamyl-tRNA(Gln) amidotransferase subunit A